MTGKICRTIVLVASVAIFPFGPPTLAGDPLVVVVNDRCSVSDISLKNLKRFYLGEITILPNGDEIKLMAFAPSEEMFCKTVLDMTPSELRRHWMKLVFGGKYATPPEDYKTTVEIETILHKNYGAICYLPLAEVIDGMKVLTIDSLSPSDEGYPLKDRAPGRPRKDK